ncbi:hypothetical protein X732_30600 [Mesorhizobium sp. L2C066B000]|nr:hypothetical protein X732_30600 [Mesorhizobium sp. L2C066B000]
MGLNPSRDVFITCAVTGAGDTAGKSVNVPVTPRQIADASIEAANAGAAIVHIHVRNPETGKAARDLHLYEEVLNLIKRSGVDVVINFTATGHLELAKWLHWQGLRRLGLARPFPSA